MSVQPPTPMPHSALTSVAERGRGKTVVGGQWSQSQRGGGGIRRGTKAIVIIQQYMTSLHMLTAAVSSEFKKRKTRRSVKEKEVASIFLPSSKQQRLLSRQRYKTRTTGQLPLSGNFFGITSTVLLNMLCSHSQFASSSTRRGGIDFPSGFSIYSPLVSRESDEGVFQKLYSETIDLQLNWEFYAHASNLHISMHKG